MNSFLRIPLAAPPAAGGQTFVATIVDASNKAAMACTKLADGSAITVTASPYLINPPFSGTYLVPAYGAGQQIVVGSLDVALTGSTALFVDLNVGSSGPKEWFYDLLTCELVAGVPTQFTRGFCCTDRH